jgi:hypothetical protein
MSIALTSLINVHAKHQFPQNDGHDGRLKDIGQLRGRRL